MHAIIIQNMRRRKIRSSLSFPANLDLAPFLDGASNDGASSSMYELCAITVHKGTAMGGHYIAFGRSNVGQVIGSEDQNNLPPPATGGDELENVTTQMQRDSEWVCFNDANVHVLTREEACKLFPAPSEAEAADEGSEATSTATPALPASEAPDSFLGSTYDVDKDAYLLIYRRCDAISGHRQTAASHSTEQGTGPRWIYGTLPRLGACLYVNKCSSGNFVVNVWSCE